ncbi:UNVERIFIED_CONTAM: hypothetical protein FKN15_070511 [Acipenser sinensis]
MSERVADIVDSGKAGDAEASGLNEVDPHNGPSHADLALPQPECPPPSASYTEAPPPYVKGHSHPKGVSNGAPPICTPPQLQVGPLVPVKCLQNHRPGNGKRLTTSSYKSQHSIKCTASQMQQSAGEDFIEGSSEPQDWVQQQQQQG